ncbi:MAG: hypothetical protein U0835_14115 [Isosphaeraceae bacterium]
MFPGIGNHFPRMGRALSLRWPEVFRRLDAETGFLRSQLGPACGWADQADAPRVWDDHRAPIMAQVVLGTAVSDLLRSFGVEPSAVIGYSLGESSALLATRAWTARDEIHRRLIEVAPVSYRSRRPLRRRAATWKLAPGEAVDWLAGIVPAPPASVRRP